MNKRQTGFTESTLEESLNRTGRLVNTEEATKVPSAKHRSAMGHLSMTIKDVERVELRFQQAKMVLPRKDKDNRHNIQNCVDAYKVFVTTVQNTINVLSSEPDKQLPLS